jgi:hypothetical protein
LAAVPQPHIAVHKPPSFHVWIALAFSLTGVALSAGWLVRCLLERMASSALFHETDHSYDPFRAMMPKEPPRYPKPLKVLRTANDPGQTSKIA